LTEAAVARLLCNVPMPRSGYLFVAQTIQAFLCRVSGYLLFFDVQFAINR